MEYQLVLFPHSHLHLYFFFFFQAEDGIRDVAVTGVQTCALPISLAHLARGGFALWLARPPPFGQDVRPRRQRERRERPWVTQGGRAGRREQLVEIGRASCRERV